MVDSLRDWHHCMPGIKSVHLDGLAEDLHLRLVHRSLMGRAPCIMTPAGSFGEQRIANTATGMPSRSSNPSSIINRAPS
jgi:hypothetical protein